jgi:hypothetical protein
MKCIRPECLFLFLALMPAFLLSQTEAPDTAFAKVSIFNLTPHSSFSNFSPVFYKDGIVFSSNRPYEVGVVHFEPGTKAHLLDLYAASLKDSFHISAPHYFSERINTVYHEGPACFSNDGNTMYFTFSGREKQGNLVQIMESHLVAGEWSIPRRIACSDSSISMAHPAISPDGKTLYFSANQPNGFGKNDLYKLVYQDGTWLGPENLGPDINTAGNESFPYIDSKGRLFFASDAQPGAQKMDVYMAEKTGPLHYKITHLPAPINSSADDFGLCSDSLGRKGFFSSNRSGRNDELYVFYDQHPYFCNCEEINSDNFCYTFFEELGEASKDTAGIAYEWSFGDSTRARGIQADHCFAKTGTYAVELNVVDRSTGVAFYNQASYSITVGSVSQLKFSVPDSVFIGEKVNLDAGKSIVPDHTIENYYWDLAEDMKAYGVTASVTYMIPGKKKIRLGCNAINKATGKVEAYCKWKYITVLPKPGSIKQ